jgi:hypothetical protein
MDPKWFEIELPLAAACGPLYNLFHMLIVNCVFLDALCAYVLNKNAF